jgi:AraC-like DNA-binding protein
VLERIQLRAASYPPDGAWLPEHGRALRPETARPGQPGEYTLEFGGNYWDAPIITGNYELQATLLQKVAAFTAAHASTERLSTKITAHLLANSYLGLPTLDELAANFHVSSRSLQRRLQEEGTSYQDVADEVRKSLALHYLQSRSHPLKEVSYMLGYNELSAFSRAFKRWTGSSPARYQAA